MASRLRVAELLADGARGVSRYTGTVLAVFVTQTLVATTCMLAIAVVLAQQFAHLPMFDEAVEGDLVAAIWCLRTGKASLFAIGGIVFGALLVWQLVSWFLIGGLIGVFSRAPEGRSETARCFGASGSATFLTYARLALCSVPGWILSLFAFGLGMGLVSERIERALTIPQLLGTVLLAALPALLLLHLFWTISDYARIELTLRHESHNPGVVKTYLRTLIFVVKRPLTLLHASVGWFAFFVISAGYVYLAQGHPMYGVEGAVALFGVRQGVALLRHAIKLAILGGQIELGRTRPLPPRRIEKTAAKT